MILRPGVRIAVDVGSVRVGLARCDRDAILATPIATLERATAVAQVIQVAAELDVLEIYVGLPLGMRGNLGSAAELAQDFARELAVSLRATPIRLVDERLSTVTAERGLKAAGRSGRTSRPVVDQAAAVVILEHALALERAQGVAPGTLVVEVP